MKIEVFNYVNIIPMNEMKEGQFAVIIGSGYEGTIVFRLGEAWKHEQASRDFVALCPDCEIPIDGYGANCPLMVRVLNKGESFKVTV